jgi:hypothetical protein
MNKGFVSKIIIITVSIFIFSTLVEPFLSFTNASNSFDSFEDNFFDDEENALVNLKMEDLDKLSDDELEDLGVITGDGADEFNHEILDDDFDFEAAVNNLDISKMEEEEKEDFLLLVQETAAISGTEEVELLEEALTGLFDGDSETFNDLEATEEQLEEKYLEKLESEQTAFSKMKNMFFGSNEVYAAKKRGKIFVGIYVAGAAFNLAIAGVVGGGVSALKSYIKKKGKKKVQEVISRVATAQAKKLKIKTIKGVAIASVIGTAVGFAINYGDPGVAIARFIDSRDWYKNNGYIDVTK